MQPTSGSVTRADVATMIQTVLENPVETNHHKYSFVNGPLPFTEAIKKAD